MLTCPKCHAGVPEGMRFCLQCGISLGIPSPAPASPVGNEPPMPAARVAPAAPHVAPSRPAPVTAPLPRQGLPAVNPKIAPIPVISPRAGAAAEHPRPSLGDQMVEIDDDFLKKSFERPITQPRAVVCRFCKGPLDLAGDYCEQCGAPLAEAAPPGALKPETQPAVPSVPPPGIPPPSLSMPAHRPAESAPAYHASAAPSPPAMPAAFEEPTHPTVELPPTPVAPASPPTLPAKERPSGFMGRLKGLFKKG